MSCDELPTRCIIGHFGEFRPAPRITAVGGNNLYIVMKYVNELTLRTIRRHDFSQREADTHSDDDHHVVTS